MAVQCIHNWATSGILPHFLSGNTIPEEFSPLFFTKRPGTVCGDSLGMPFYTQDPKSVGIRICSQCDNLPPAFGHFPAAWGGLRGIFTTMSVLTWKSFHVVLLLGIVLACRPEMILSASSLMRRRSDALYDVPSFFQPACCRNFAACFQSEIKRLSGSILSNYNSLPVKAFYLFHRAFCRCDYVVITMEPDIICTAEWSCAVPLYHARRRQVQVALPDGRRI